MAISEDNILKLRSTYVINPIPKAYAPFNERRGDL